MQKARFLFRPGLLYAFLGLQAFSAVAALFVHHAGSFLAKLAGFGLLYGAIYLIEKGTKAKAEYEADPYAKAPEHPYLLYGALTTGVAVFWIALFNAKIGPGSALFAALLAVVGSLLYYGTDPREDRFVQEGQNAPELFESLHTAREKLENLHLHLEAVQNPELKSALATALKRAEAVVRHLYEHPALISRARKFLVVYLEGVEGVMARYRATPPEAVDSTLRDELIALLQEAARRFDSELKRLQEDDRFNLEVDIETLRRQLNEGV
ncbi:MAG: hypothetical protein GXO33_05040 [Epsilonproteobacteria bacterium]|nr:hypothetical protein [Campylobacterota bacterium]